MLAATGCADQSAAVVNLQQKAAKEAAWDAERRGAELRANGYTVFRYDFAPQFTRSGLSLGDAFRELKKLTGYKVGFWRCPVGSTGPSSNQNERPRTVGDHL